MGGGYDGAEYCHFRHAACCTPSCGRMRWWWAMGRCVQMSNAPSGKGITDVRVPCFSYSPGITSYDYESPNYSSLDLGFIYLASLSLHACFFSNFKLSHKTEIHPLIYDWMSLLFFYKVKMLSFLNTLLKHATAISVTQILNARNY